MPPPLKMHPRRGRAADGRVRLEICEDIRALVGSDKRSSWLAFHSYSIRPEKNCRGYEVDCREQERQPYPGGHRRYATLDSRVVVGFSVPGRAPIRFRIPGPGPRGNCETDNKNCKTFVQHMHARLQESDTGM